MTTALTAYLQNLSIIFVLTENGCDGPTGQACALAPSAILPIMS